MNLLDHFDESIAGLQDGKYATKPFAAIAGRFRMTILVNADSFFYKKTGHDLRRAFPCGDIRDSVLPRQGIQDGRTKSKSIGLVPRGEATKLKSPEQPILEGGPMAGDGIGSGCFDKRHSRTVMSLLFTARMNTKYIRDKETYVHVLGDKETYWLATELSNTPYYFQQEYAGLTRILKPASMSKICSTHILHMDYTGEMPLWFNSGLLLNKTSEGEELGTFTHFITSGANMSDQLALRYNDNEYRCAEGKPAVALTEKKMDVVLGQILQVARKVEEALAT